MAAHTSRLLKIRHLPSVTIETSYYTAFNRVRSDPGEPAPRSAVGGRSKRRTCNHRRPCRFWNRGHKLVLENPPASIRYDLIGASQLRAAPPGVSQAETCNRRRR